METECASKKPELPCVVKSNSIRPDASRTPYCGKKATKVDNLKNCLGLQVETLLKLVISPASNTATSTLNKQEVCVVCGRESNCLCLSDRDQSHLGANTVGE